MAPVLLAALILGTDAVFLRHQALVDLACDSAAAVETSLEVVIPLDASGVSRFSTLSVPYDSWNETVTVITAELHPLRPGRPDSEAASTERPRPGLAEAGRLESNFREYLIEFPGLETGDTIFVSTRREIRRLPLADAYSYSFYTQSSDSIHSSSFTVRWPNGVPLHFTGPGPLSDFTSDGVRTVEWRSGPMEPLPVLPLGVPVEQEAGHVTISSHSPGELGVLLYGILDPGIPSGEELSALAPVLDSTGTDPDTLRAWVASNISYLGSGIGTDPGFTPRTPSETLSDRCGVCRDKSVLLAALLRAAGHGAWLGLTRTSHPLDPLCGIRDFDHMVVLLDRDGVLDVLDPSTTGHSTPASYALRGLPVLPLAPWCEGYVTVPDPGLDSLRMRVSLGFSPGLDSLRGTMEVGFAGAADELWRDMLSRVDPGAWPELLEALFGVSPGSSLGVHGDPCDPLSDFSVSGTVSIPSRAVESGGIRMILPGLADLDVAGSRVSALLLSAPDRDGRVQGTDTPLLEVLEGAVAIPGGMTASPPGPFAGGGYSVSAGLEGDSLVWTEICDLGNHPAGTLRETAASRCSGDGRRIRLEEP